jgi:hypothetical protein
MTIRIFGFLSLAGGVHGLAPGGSSNILEAFCALALPLRSWESAAPLAALIPNFSTNARRLRWFFMTSTIPKHLKREMPERYWGTSLHA